MKAYYSSIGQEINLGATLASLPRRDQVDILIHLMQEVGVIELLYSKMNLFPAQKQTLEKLMAKLFEQYVEKEREAMDPRALAEMIERRGLDALGRLPNPHPVYRLIIDSLRAFARKGE